MPYATETVLALFSLGFVSQCLATGYSSLIFFEKQYKTLYSVMMFIASGMYFLLFAFNRINKREGLFF